MKYSRLLLVLSVVLCVASSARARALPQQAVRVWLSGAWRPFGPLDRQSLREQGCRQPRRWSTAMPSGFLQHLVVARGAGCGSVVRRRIRTFIRETSQTTRLLFWKIPTATAGPTSRPCLPTTCTFRFRSSLEMEVYMFPKSLI